MMGEARDIIHDALGVGATELSFLLFEPLELFLGTAHHMTEQLLTAAVWAGEQMVQRRAKADLARHTKDIHGPAAFLGFPTGTRGRRWFGDGGQEFKRPDGHSVRHSMVNPTNFE